MFKFWIRAAITMVLTIALLVFSGCQKVTLGRGEIDELIFVGAVGVDKSEEGNLVKVVVSSKRIKAQAGGGASEKTTCLYYSEGETIAEALSDIHTFAGRRPFWGHLEYIVFGESIAQDGLGPYLDYFCRDHEIRLNSRVVVCRGRSAQELLEIAAQSEEFLSVRLYNLFQAASGKSVTDIVELSDLMYTLDNPCLEPFVPFVDLVERVKKQEEEMMGIQLGGFAVFKEDKLRGYLTEEESAGFNWIRNKVKSGILAVKDEQGKSVALEIIDSSSKMDVAFENGLPVIFIRIRMTSNIDEVQSTEDIFNSQMFELLERRQEELIKSQVAGTVAVAQNNNTDFIGAANAIHHEHPLKWKEIEGDWEELFPETEIKVEVESKINRTYTIREANMAESGE